MAKKRIWELPYTKKEANDLMGKFGKLMGGGLYKRKIGRGDNKGYYYVYQKPGYGGGYFRNNKSK